MDFEIARIFNGRQHGNCVSLRPGSSEGALARLMANAHRTLEPGARFEVRRKTTKAGDNLCWYSDDAMQRVWPSPAGYELVGRYVARGTPPPPAVVISTPCPPAAECV